MEKDDDVDEPTNHNAETFVPYGILHACVCCKVPVPSLVEIALLLFPEQVFKRDTSHGMIPLHHVLCAKHKYSYATSNLLTILLKGRANVSAPLSSKYTRKSKIETMQSEREVESTAARMPKLPSLLNCTQYDDGEDNNKLLLSQWPNARYLQSTVLLPFQRTNDSSGTKYHNEKDIREFKGTIPLIFAIRSGLPMDGVINKLLEADSHETLRTLDPISKLPPFALIAIEPCRNELEEHQPRSDSWDAQQFSDLSRNEGATAAILSTQSGKHHSNDIIAAAIGSTINILSSGGGNNDIEMPSTSAMFSFSSSSISSSDDVCTNSTRRSPTENNITWSAYKLDDIYRLLLAHPQVLAQCIAN